MFNLVRDLETPRDKEQETAFESSLNFSLFKDTNKRIHKIDSWNFSNLKKFVNNLEKKKIIITLEFSRWNRNIEYIFSKLETNITETIKLPEKTRDIFRERDIIGIHNAILKAKDDKNMKMSILLLMAEIIGDDFSMKITNKSLNTNIPTLDITIDSLLPRLIFTIEENE